jgi:glycosyltransferase involved in cell wall biosynthesis
MQLSIIIPLYNSGHFLNSCIESLLRQDIDIEDYEILIINDGSTDDSLNIASELVKKYSNVLVHSKKNGGVGSARNFGLSFAKGEYIYFIDPDDYLAPNVIKAILNVAQTHSLDILTFLSQKTNSSNLFKKSVQEKNINPSDIHTGIEFIANNVFQNEVWWYFIKRTFLEKANIKFIEDRWMEDAIITVQLFLSANKIAKLELDAHRYLVFEGSAMTNKEPAHYIRVIDDNRNAAAVFEDIINTLIQKGANSKCIERLRTKQQSFVFFMMVRMLRSTMSIDEVKRSIGELSLTNAYPLNSFPGQDYKGISYKVLTLLFNSKRRFYSLFRLINPVFKVIS